MKKLLTILVILLVQIASGQGARSDREFDNGSGIADSDLKPGMINELELLGKIWGFLKYHHPAIGSGKFNMDYELFRVLPGYLRAETKLSRDKILLQWIDKFGKPAACDSCTVTPVGAVLKPEFDWLNNSYLDTIIKKRIHDIYKGRHQGRQYYVAQTLLGNPEFLNESGYVTMKYPDAGFRLLSLYKYWNMIQYFYPNRQLTDKPWKDLLKEYIPQFLDAANELEYELAALHIIAEINDSHARLREGGDKIQEARGSYYAPFHVRFVENKLTVDDYFRNEERNNSPLKIGDVITHVNGKKVEDIVKKMRPDYPASNEGAKMREISFNILRSVSDKIRLDFTVAGKSKSAEIQLYPMDSLAYYTTFKPDSSRSYRMLGNNIGYVTLKSIRQSDPAKIREVFKNTRGIIVDIRNYPFSYVPNSLGSFFVSSPRPFVKFTKGNISNPGEFTFTDPLLLSPSGPKYTGKLIVLVDENSISQAEYTAMALRAGDNTTIIGNITSGADGNVSQFTLPGGLRTAISGLGVYYPDGTNTQRAGIIPVIIVKPTIQGIQKGRDEVLDKAIDLILH